MIFRKSTGKIMYYFVVEGRETREEVEKTYHLPLACEARVLLLRGRRRFFCFLLSLKSPPSRKEGWHEVTGW
jgi:hypothetical protein